MRRKRSGKHPAADQARPSRRIHEQPPGKLREPAVCPSCGASYREGRWTWKAATADATEHRCPACERIETDYPAGLVHLEGDFLRSHHDELIRLIENFAERESSEHPLNRIMAITEEPAGAITVTVTEGKLALSLGHALQHAYDGTLEHPPTTSEKGNLVRVHWARD